MILHAMPEQTPDAERQTAQGHGQPRLTNPRGQSSIAYPADGSGRLDANVLTNPPGQSSIAYRLGTYATFFQAMIDQLPAQMVDGASRPPLAALTTRDSSDLAIALLDAWAVICDVITFYQERHANEGYLRTARERRSVLELARAIGYEFDPGVAASTSLAFTVAAARDNSAVVIPTGTQVQSAPAQGQQPQIFETVEPLEARPEWNAMRPRLTQGQVVKWGDLRLVLAGTSTQLQIGQPIFFKHTILGTIANAGIVQAVAPDSATNTTAITWQPPLQGAYGDSAPPQVVTFRKQAALFGYNAPAWDNLPPAVQAQYCTTTPSPINCVAFAPDGTQAVSGQADGSIIFWRVGQTIVQSKRFIAHSKAVLSVAFAPDSNSVLSGGADGQVIMWDTTGKRLRSYQGLQGAANSVAFAPDGKRVLAGGADMLVILWDIDEPTKPHTFRGHQGPVNSVAFSPSYADDKQFLSGSADQTVKLWQTTSQPPLQTFSGHRGPVNSVAFSPSYADDKQFLSGSADQTLIVWLSTSPSPSKTLRQHLQGVTSVAYSPNTRGASGLSASLDTTLTLWNLDTGLSIQNVVQIACSDWPGFALAGRQLDLATADPAIVPGSALVLWKGDARTYAAYEVQAVETVVLNSFMLSAKVTRITLSDDMPKAGFDRRTTIVLTQEVPLPLAMIPISAPLPPCAEQQGSEDDSRSIQLDRIVPDLRKGQLLALSGEQYDCQAARANRAAIRAGDIVKIQEIQTDSSQQYTTLTFESPLPKRYVRSSVTLNGNIAPATQGETVPGEILGSGDGKRPNQQFALRRGPLTYVPAPTASGSQSTLSVYVDQVRWRQVASFYGLDPRSRSYIVRTDETGQATVIFGDGQQGARLPSGQENVVASYRVGIGLVGEVPAGALTQLKNQPMRVNTVVNPLAATGAAPPDTPESARIKAPLTVSTLGRIVSLQDYDDFTRTFAGVGRSRTSLLWNGRRPVMHITILGTDGQPIADDSALSTSLAAAIDALRDPAQPVLIQSGDKRTFGVTAKVLAQPDYQLQPIQDAVRAALAVAFSLDRRAFGQGLAASEVMTVVQSVPGVLAVELICLYLSDEKPQEQQDGTLSCRLESYLTAELAHWDGKAFVPDQIIVIDAQDGIELHMEPTL